jgi:hypothetical protein
LCRWNWWVKELMMLVECLMIPSLKCVRSLSVEQCLCWCPHQMQQMILATTVTATYSIQLSVQPSTLHGSNSLVCSYVSWQMGYAVV